MSSKHRGVGGVFFFIVGAEHSGGNSTVVAAEDAGLFTRFVANTDRPSVPIVDWVSNIDIIDEKLFHIASVVLAIRVEQVVFVIANIEVADFAVVSFAFSRIEASYSSLVISTPVVLWTPM